MGSKKVIAFGIFGLLICATCSGDIIYVDDDASGINNGTTWEHAYVYLQDALMMASEGDEIRVAQGVYRPDDFVLSDRPNMGRAETFQLKSGVTIKGGYAGADNPDARDVQQYETVLSGDLDDNDISLESFEWETVRSFLEHETRSENAYSVVTGSNTDSTAVLDGVKITGGNANVYGTYGPGNIISSGWENIYHTPDNNGGGMYIKDGDPTVVDCTFYRNTALSYQADTGGGAICNVNSEPIITNCRFIENIAFSGDVTTRGGAVLNIDNSNALISGCRFERNLVSGFDDEYYGGAMCNAGSGVRMTDCVFVENQSLYSRGGAVYSYESYDRFRGCDFIRNRATYQSGAVLCAGPGWGPLNNISFVECRFIENSCTFSAASLFSSANNLTIDRCIFTNGISGDYGPAIDNWFNNVVITNTLFAGNKSGGSAIIDNFNNRLRLTNCTLAGNTVDGGGNVVFSSHFCNLDISHCIFWGNEIGEGPQIRTGEAVKLTIDYCDIQGGQDAVQHDDSSDPGYELYWGPGNIDIDPLFADPQNGDYHLKSQIGHWDDSARNWAADDATSPCIDAGNMGMPIDEEPFPNGGIINLGAYGGTDKASKSYFNRPPCESIIAGDINGDCIVSLPDFAIMAYHWLESDQGPAMTYDVQECDGLIEPDNDGLRFSITVEGHTIHFTDNVRANCCPEEIKMDLEIEDHTIFIYETERVKTPCDCICDFPVKAAIGPLVSGTYTIIVHEHGKYIGTADVMIP